MSHALTKVIAAAAIVASAQASALDASIRLPPPPPNFEAAMQTVSPVTDREIDAALRKIDESRAAMQNATPPPVAVGANMQVSLDPGAEIPVISLAPGYATAVTVLDMAGNPWPIEGIRVGADALFAVVIDEKGSTPQTLTIAPKEPHGHSNLIIKLKGSDLPIVASLRTNNGLSNYRVNLLVPRLGPNAAPVEYETAPPLNDALLRHVLDGITPVGAINVPIAGGSASAVISEGRFIVRTSLRVRSPGYTAVMRSGGVSVYEMPISSVISATNDLGQEVMLTVDDETLLDAAFGQQDRGFRSPYAMPVSGSSQ